LASFSTVSFWRSCSSCGIFFSNLRILVISILSLEMITLEVLFVLLSPLLLIMTTSLGLCCCTMSTSSSIKRTFNNLSYHYDRKNRYCPLFFLSHSRWFMIE
jgi:hypothetical protein